MAELFRVNVSGISRHLANVFASGELDEKRNLQKMQIANSDKPVTYYSLDVIISVGYRVNSIRATDFRNCPELIRSSISRLRNVCMGRLSI